MLESHPRIPGYEVTLHRALTEPVLLNTSATVFVTFAVTGGSPNASRAG